MSINNTMNKNSTFLLAMAVLSLSGALLVWRTELLKSENGVSRQEAFIPDVFDYFASDDIRITSVERNVRMTHGENGWYADSNTGKKVSIVFVEDFFRAVSDMMIGDVVSENPENFAQYGLTQASGVSVEFWSGGLQKHVLVIGNEGPVPGSVYVRFADTDRVWLVKSLIREVVRREVEGILDMSIWKVNPSDVLAVHILSSKEKLQTFFSRTAVENEDYILKNQGNKSTDQKKLADFVSLVSSLQASSLADEQDFSKAGLTKEYARIVLRTADGKDHVLLFGNTVNDGKDRLVAEEGGTTVYAVSETLVQTNLLLRAADFLNEDLPF